MSDSSPTLLDPAAVDALKATLGGMLTRNHRIVLQLTAGLSEEAAREPLVADGSSARWLVGHLAGYRDVMLETLGGERLQGPALDEAFGYGSKPEGEPEATLAELIAAYTAAEAPLNAALEAASAEDLARPSGKTTVRQRFEFLLWHEAYHLGQLMLYRRAAGLDNPIG
mgnify:CR=1 FL=1